MSQPPPSRVPEEILRGAGVGIREYYTRLTSGLYYLWDQLKNITESRVTLIENALPGISGGVPSNAADTDHDLTFSSGYISTGGTVYEVSEITKQIDAAWAEGSDAGGKFSGATIGNTDDYYCIAISKDSSPTTIDIGFDDNASGTNAPSGWTVLREIFRGMTDSSGNIRDILTTELPGGGLRCFYDVDVNEFSDINPGTSAVLKTLSSVPPDTLSVACYQTLDFSPADDTFTLITETSQTDTTPSSSNQDSIMINSTDGSRQGEAVTLERTVDSSRQIRYRLSNSDAGVHIRCYVSGYILQRVT